MYGLFGMTPPEPEKKRMLRRADDPIRCDNFRPIADRKLARDLAAVLRQIPRRPKGPAEPPGDEWWEAVLRDRRAEGKPKDPFKAEK